MLEGGDGTIQSYIFESFANGLSAESAEDLDDYEDEEGYTTL